MEKFDSIKMEDLLKVEDPDADGGLTLIFKNGTKVKILLKNGVLESLVQQS